MLQDSIQSNRIFYNTEIDWVAIFPQEFIVSEASWQLWFEAKVAESSCKEIEQKKLWLVDTFGEPAPIGRDAGRVHVIGRLYYHTNMTKKS